MKKFLVLLLALLMLTGCFKRDEMENINIITTVYPIEYITNRLYGDNSKVSSTYPKGVDINNYKLTEKQLKDASDEDLFIYNGESSEREIATAMLNYNKRLKIIDASYGIDASNSLTDIWLNPSNILMVAQNIRNDLEQYISNPYIKKELNEQYEQLKLDISSIQTELKTTADNSVNNQIISLSEELNFLKKYGFDVINLIEDNKNKDNNINLAKSLLKNKKLTYIFVNENETNNELVQSLIKDYKVEKLVFKNLTTISEEDLRNNEDYLSLMYQNIENLKKEVYK